MFHFLCAIVLSAPALENIKVELFERWSEADLFPMVSFGMPTQQELLDVEICLDDLVVQLNIASGLPLSEEERTVELAFLNGMLAGLRPADSANATLCIRHLEGLDDAVFGFSASKMWRMRLQAYVALEEHRAAQHAAQELRSLRHVSIEDQTVLALFDVSQLVKDPDASVEEAVKRFQLHDQSLIDDKYFHLRNAFASGVLSLMNSDIGRKQILTTRLSQDMALLQHPVTARETLRKLNNRLTSPIKFSKSDEQPVFRSIALWNEVDALKPESPERVSPLVELALQGNHEASTELLSAFDSNPITREHIDLLFDNAVVTNDKNVREYWTLQRAIHYINNNQREEGFEQLYLIPESSIYAEDASRVLRQIHELNADVLTESLKQSAGDLNACSSMVQSWNAATRLKVARELISRSHEKPAEWQRNSIKAILSESIEFPNHLSGELYRLLGDSTNAAKCFKLAIEQDGETIHTLTGLADVTRDAEGMKRVLRATSQDANKSYWYWLANLRLVEWHLQDGGDKVDAIAKINRLRKMDASLGGTHFQHLFNELSE